MCAVPNLWTSEPIRPTETTCVDVNALADEQSVVLGQLGDVWSHDLRLSPSEARRVAAVLIAGAEHCESAAKH